jgi:hypothetical protein
MPIMEWILDITLMVLLAATLFHAMRLERALGVLKRDRAALEALVSDFNASTRAAEAGIERLHLAVDGSGREIQRQIETATVIKDDLTFLVQRGEGLADRLDETVRATRPGGGQQGVRQAYPAQISLSQMGQSQPGHEQTTTTMERASREAEPKVRSQAERDLLKALRMVR